MLELPRDRWTLVTALRAQAQKYGDREFIRFKDGGTLSFRDVDHLSSKIAAAFARQGITAGDRIVAIAENCPELVLTLFAANKLNAIFVPLNTQLKGVFLEHQLRNSAPKVLIVDNTTSVLLGTVSASVKDFDVVVTVGASSEDDRRRFGAKKLHSFNEMARLEVPAARLAEPTPGDISTVIYTSGTTGPSKGVMMPHAHCYLLGYNPAGRMR